MARRVSLNADLLTYNEIAEHHAKIKKCIKNYYLSANDDEFANLTPAELDILLKDDLLFQDYEDTLVLLTYIESIFRVDFTVRCQLKLRDSISKKFREIQKVNGKKVSLERDILACWKKSGNLQAKLSEMVNHAIKFRHWLAHGQYWTPKLHRTFDFYELSSLVEALAATELLKSAPVEGGP